MLFSCMNYDFMVFEIFENRWLQLESDYDIMCAVFHP